MRELAAMDTKFVSGGFVSLELVFPAYPRVELVYEPFYLLNPYPYAYYYDYVEVVDCSPCFDTYY